MRVISGTDVTVLSPAGLAPRLFSVARWRRPAGRASARSRGRCGAPRPPSVRGCRRPAVNRRHTRRPRAGRWRPRCASRPWCGRRAREVGSGVRALRCRSRRLHEQVVVVHHEPDPDDHQHEQGVHGGRTMRARNACTRASASASISGSGFGRRPRLLGVTIADFFLAAGRGAVSAGQSSLAGGGAAGGGSFGSSVGRTARFRGVTIAGTSIRTGFRFRGGRL
jgi:hypothetical protein